jgi:hypothetical protein
VVARRTISSVANNQARSACFRLAMKHVFVKAEAYKLTSDELLERMPKEQAVILVQGLLRRMEGSLNVPDIPAAKIRMEKVLEELKLS